MAGYPTYIQQQYENDPRRALVAALMQQAQQQQQNVVHPFQALSSLANTALGSYRGKKLNEEYAGKAEGYNKALAAALGAENPEQALQFAQQNPGVMEQYGPAFMQQQRAQQQRAAQRGEELADAGVKRTQQLGDSAVARQQALDDQRARFAQEEKVARLRASDGGNRGVQFLSTPGGYFAGNLASGQASPVMVNNQPLMPSAIDPTTQGAVAGAKATATQAAESSAEKSRKLPVLQSMDYLAGRIKDANAQTSTGGPMGIVGKAAGVFDYQDATSFDNLTQQLSTDLRAIFRIPGEGTLSDREQALYGLQLPSRNFDPEKNAAILQDLQTRAALRLQGSQPQATAQTPVAPAAGGLPAGVTEDDISTTMRAHGMTREQVLARLRGG